MLKDHLKTLTAYMVVHLQSNGGSASSDSRKKKLMIITIIMISAF